MPIHTLATVNLSRPKLTVSSKVDFEMAKQNVQDRGTQIPRNAEYLFVREVPRDAAQQRYWTFCEAIKLTLGKKKKVRLVLYYHKLAVFYREHLKCGFVQAAVVRGAKLKNAANSHKPGLFQLIPDFGRIIAHVFQRLGNQMHGIIGMAAEGGDLVIEFGFIRFFIGHQDLLLRMISRHAFGGHNPAGRKDRAFSRFPGRLGILNIGEAMALIKRHIQAELFYVAGHNRLGGYD